MESVFQVDTDLSALQEFLSSVSKATRITGEVRVPSFILQDCLLTPLTVFYTKVDSLLPSVLIKVVINGVTKELSLVTVFYCRKQLTLLQNEKIIYKSPSSYDYRTRELAQKVKFLEQSTRELSQKNEQLEIENQRQVFLLNKLETVGIMHSKAIQIMTQNEIKLMDKTQDSADVCAICCDLMKTKEFSCTRLKVVHCNHEFHYECLQKYIDFYGTDNLICPYCRQSITATKIV